MKNSVFLLVALCLAITASAASVNVVDPARRSIDAQSALSPESAIDLGTVGPGQKLEIIVQTGTGEISRQNQTVSNQEADWDQLHVLSDSLPEDWVGQDSLRFDSPLKAFVVVGKDSAQGEYDFLLKARDDFEEVPSLVFTGRAKVSLDVFSIKIAGEPVKTDPRSKATYQLELDNKGSASDVFEIRVSGLPKELEKTQTVFVPHNTKVVVDFQVDSPEAGEYPLTFTAHSLSNARINSRASTVLFAGSSLNTDLKAAARGVLLFPSAEQLIYAILAFIGSLL